MARNQNSGHVKLWSPRKPPARRRGPASPSRYGPGSELVGPALAGTARELPDVNVVRHRGRLLTLAESHRPYRLGAELETLGPETFDGNLPAGITAHPKIDPRTGEMAVFCYHPAPTVSHLVNHSSGRHRASANSRRGHRPA